MSKQHARASETRVWEERTDQQEAPAADEPRRGASRWFRLRHPQGRSEAEDPGGRSPEGLREAKGAIRLRGLRTEDVRDWTRGLSGGRRRRVGKLPRYVLSRHVCSRGRGVRFILHAEGSDANCRINPRV